MRLMSKWLNAATRWRNGKYSTNVRNEGRFTARVAFTAGIAKSATH